MLYLQEYLRGNAIESLERDFGIYAYNHPTLPLIGFKYGLIQSEKLKRHPIVRECRGIVLERDSWNVIAYPFNRFFNLGEDPQTESEFNWQSFTCQEKLDGSIIILYYYAGQWRVNTSGSFAQGVCYDAGQTWEELFWATSGIDKYKLETNYTYIFELWTKYNKIVRSYEKPTVTLLGIREMENFYEADNRCLKVEAQKLAVNRPIYYDMKSIYEITNFLLQTSSTDPTFEGFVLCDSNFNRIKVKSVSYKQLHQLKGNGQFIYRNIIPQILKGNFSTLSRDFPEWLEELEECSRQIKDLKTETDNIWYTYQSLRDRKKFAQSILKEATLPSLLFYLYDSKYGSVEQAFSQSEDLLIKYFEGKK